MNTVIKENISSTLYETDNSNECSLKYKDQINMPGQKPINAKEKGAFNQNLAAQIYKLLSSYHIRTFYIKEKPDNSLLVKNVEWVPVFNLVRNMAAGNLVSRFGLEEGKELDCPLIEYYLHAANDEDQLISEDHIISFGYASKDELREMHRMASKVNVILKDFFRRRGIKVVDFKLEFGRNKDKNMVLTGDFAIENCHLMNIETNAYLLSDKDAGDKNKLLADLKILQEKMAK